MPQAKPLSSSQEDYLEAILRLVKKNRVARVKEIAEALGVRMPSVTSALKQLKDRQMIRYEKNSYITLTDEGARLAEAVDERHRILVRFLVGVLAVDEPEAEATACRIEHAIGNELCRRIGLLSDRFDTLFLSGESSTEAWKTLMKS